MSLGHARFLETGRQPPAVAMVRRGDEAVDGWSWSAHMCSNTVRYHGGIVVGYYCFRVVYNEGRWRVRSALG